MPELVLDLAAVDRTRAPEVGGKAANLGEVARLDGGVVPPAFCVTTAAWARFRDSAGLAPLLDALAGVAPDDRAGLLDAGARVRARLAATPVPEELATPLVAAWRGLPGRGPCAVRSSATAEDLPDASFAGQHDSCLGVEGAAAVVEAVRRVWVSSYSHRALAYRGRLGLDARGVHMGVLVQRQVAARVSGVLFTADPVSGHRRVAVIEAVSGLGDAFVAGHTAGEALRVRAGRVEARTGGSTGLLTDEEALALVALGRRLEAHFGAPQDVEWCLAEDGVHVVQSRPITTLHAIPAVTDGQPHVWVSVGHGQMMTDAMMPLGLSVFRQCALRPMDEAGGRLFVDVTAALVSPVVRAGLLDVFGRSDPLLRDALETLLARGELLPTPPTPTPSAASPTPSSPTPTPSAASPTPPAPTPSPAPPPDPDPAIVPVLLEETRASVAALRERLRPLSGPALVDAIVADFPELKRVLADPRSTRAVMAGMDAAAWLDDHVYAWLGEVDAARVLAQSVPGNVTSEMGLALLDVADVLRAHPAVVASLEHAGDGFLDELDAVDGGPAARAAIQAWLDVYGMRGPGEIDLTRPRWAEEPVRLVPLLLGHVRRYPPGEAARRFERGRQEAEAAERSLLARLRALPDGERMATDTERRIRTLRAFAGLREAPKYGMICRLFVYKQALTAEARRLVDAGVLRTPDELHLLTLAEVGEVVRTRRVDPALFAVRAAEHRKNEAAPSPRVLTSDGEGLDGRYHREVPPGALAGMPVSPGVVEGRARVLTELGDPGLAPGDILVTPHTDPSWTPLFVVVAGLITEVGGLMTHGAVIAREYGLPAVVGVRGASTRIRDGQHIRLDGTAGLVEMLD